MFLSQSTPEEKRNDSHTHCTVARGLFILSRFLKIFSNIFELERSFLNKYLFVQLRGNEIVV